MLIEIKIKIGHNSIFNIPQANFKSAHLLHKMAKGFIFNPTTVRVNLKSFYTALMLETTNAIEERRKLSLINWR